MVVSDHATPRAFVDAPARWACTARATLRFPTMARAPEAQGGASRLVALKAVPAGYPLRGKPAGAAQPATRRADTRDVPARGEAWVDAARLLDAGP